MPAGATYEPIATTTISGTSTANYTFSSIPSTYTDLKLIIAGTAANACSAVVQFNADTGSNYSATYMSGDGSAINTGRLTSQTNAYIGNFRTTISLLTLDLFNYANTSVNKTSLSTYSNANNEAGRTVTLWRSTAAINSIKIYPDGYNFGNGTTFTLYGIKAA